MVLQMSTRKASFLGIDSQRFWHKRQGGTTAFVGMCVSSGFARCSRGCRYSRRSSSAFSL